MSTAWPVKWRRVRLNYIVAAIEMGDFTMAECKCLEIKRFSKQQLSLNMREERLAIALVNGMLG